MNTSYSSWFSYDPKVGKPWIVDDQGDLIKTSWEAFVVFFNNEFDNTEAALEYWNS